jgi:hypothetical protein
MDDHHPNQITYQSFVVHSHEIIFVIGRKLAYFYLPLILLKTEYRRILFMQAYVHAFAVRKYQGT